MNWEKTFIRYDYRSSQKLYRVHIPKKIYLTNVGGQIVVLKALERKRFFRTCEKQKNENHL